MDYIYIELSLTHGHPKRFTSCLTFTHSLTHSYTDGGVSHARRHPARREQLGLGVLLKDTSTLGPVEPGIEPPTFRFVDNLHEPMETNFQKVMESSCFLLFENCVDWLCKLKNRANENINCAKRPYIPKRFCACMGWFFRPLGKGVFLEIMK